MRIEPDCIVSPSYSWNDFFIYRVISCYIFFSFTNLHLLNHRKGCRMYNLSLTHGLMQKNDTAKYFTPPLLII